MKNQTIDLQKLQELQRDLSNRTPWIPFTEGKPPKTEEYLVGGGGGPVTVMTYNAEHDKWLFEAGLPFPVPMEQGVDLKFTHWMPLPPPPIE